MVCCIVVVTLVVRGSLKILVGSSVDCIEVVCSTVDEVVDADAG